MATSTSLRTGQKMSCQYSFICLRVFRESKQILNCSNICTFEIILLRGRMLNGILTLLISGCKIVPNTATNHRQQKDTSGKICCSFCEVPGLSLIEQTFHLCFHWQPNWIYLLTTTILDQMLRLSCVTTLSDSSICRPKAEPHCHAVVNGVLLSSQAESYLFGGGWHLKRQR